MEINRKGDLAEIKAVAWLWEQGYEVFRNCGCTGPVDLIATKDGEIIKIDVKTVQWTGQGWNYRKGKGKSRKQLEKEGITLLYYYKNNFYWKQLDIPEPD